MNENAKTDEIIYAENVKIPVFMPVSEVDGFKREMVDKTNGQIGIEDGEIGYKKNI